MRMSRFRIFVLFLVLGACDCGDDDSPPPGSCTTNVDCLSVRGRCVDGMCVPGSDGGTMDAGDAAQNDSSVVCEDERPACGVTNTCCAADEICEENRCIVDCGEATRCAGMCCDEGLVCEDNACVADCEDESKRCGADSNICCGAEEVCLSDSCIPLGGVCTRTEECEVDELCDPVVMRCLPRSAVEVCEFRPPVGEFSPRTACQWRPPPGDPYPGNGDVVQTPSVMNLTDDNGDGETNELDTPDIVFVSFNYATQSCCTANGIVRVISGLCNDDGTMDTIATLDTYMDGDVERPLYIDNSSGIALGNVHPAGETENRNPEIIATMRRGTVAWERVEDDGSEWRVLWRNTEYPNGTHTLAGAQPTLVDLNSDGRPEVLVGNVVLDGLTGELIWDGKVTVGASAGVGNNAFLGPNSTAADIDLDGVTEVIAGNTVYNGPDGALEWTYEYEGAASACQGGLPCDGFNAVGNFDEDDFGEVVIVRRGEVFILEHDGTEKHRIRIPVDDCARNESGPPTIADFDGDGFPEIGTAGADFYVVIDLQCVLDDEGVLPADCEREWVRWTAPNNDCSSRATGSSVFDFEGDGNAEVVYADERNFRIFDGRTGEVLYDDPSHSSNTRMEMPLVVDVDNDGKSEVVVPEPNRGGPELGGIEIWEDSENNWVRTRRVWNQHSYHVTNISEDGQVPAMEPPNWMSSRLNNFRQNVQPGGLFDAPDLFIVSVEEESCDGGGFADIAVTVGNRGALGVAAGVPVIAYALADDAAEEVFLGVQRTTRFLLPGQEERIIFRFTPAEGFTFGTYTVRAIVDSDGEGGSEYNECIEDNNEGDSEVLRSCGLG